MGEASRRKNLFQLPSAISRIRVDADIIWPGSDRALLQEVGDRAEGKRKALAAALGQVVLGEARCTICKMSLDGLDAFDGLVVAYMEVGGRRVPTSPWWIVCEHCVGQGHAEHIAGELIDQFMTEQGVTRIRFGA
jgi:hypothetical protein